MRFPSLRIERNAVVPEGSFAATQAQYLRPDERASKALGERLAATGTGVVAHFYMDPQIQGVLNASGFKHVFVADSLAMADRAVEMAKAGVRNIAVLGVDFMSENVRATLDRTGFGAVNVYRLTESPIGCSLAEAAEARAYGAYLTQASMTPKSLHVIYINTSLRVKAKAELLVPTITCTSSNVLQTILASAAQIPGVEIWFGPDTYMGENLKHVLTDFTELDDATVRAVHPEHTVASIASLLPRFHFFQQGTCIVHHMFGAQVTSRVRENYADAYITAHFEVPGEMFALAREAQRAGRGVVGSTSDILKFISSRVTAATVAPKNERLTFVLGTESGMITSIVREVQTILRRPKGNASTDPVVEIVFPVADDAITTVSDPALAVAPGVTAGEGCSASGGCATCPYMKMNSLERLFRLLDRIGASDPALGAFKPKTYDDLLEGRTVADLGSESIMAMRHFQQTGHLSDALTRTVLERSCAAPTRAADSAAWDRAS